MREQNMAAFIALTDKWGAAVDCCDTDTHNHGFGRGTYSKQGICCQKPDVVKQRTIKDATLAEPIDYPYCGTKTSTLEIDPDLTPESPPQETSPNDASEEYS
jgi:hypothetical protein